jgi:uncharacterized membrane protein YeaQ/YmgE (transglycosylase-associated protein family)
MGAIIGFIGATVGGGIGWWLGERAGFMTAFILSTIGSGIGIFLARRWAKEYLP